LTEPDPDYSPDAGTGLLSSTSYKRCYTRNFTSGKSDVYMYVLAAAARRGFKMVLFTEPVSRRNTFVGGTCAPPRALLVKKVSLRDTRHILGKNLVVYYFVCCLYFFLLLFLLPFVVNKDVHADDIVLVSHSILQRCK